MGFYWKQGSVVSFNRYAKRADTTQATIVDVLRKRGYSCYVIGWPCDLLVYRPDIGFRTLEVKTPNRKDGSYRPRKDQATQSAFIELTRTPIVTTPEQALEALR